MRSELCRGLLIASVCFAGCRKTPPQLVVPQEVHAPQMDADALAQTDAAQQGKSGPVKLEYCVAPSGETHDVRVVQSLSPDVDRLAVETVQGWTFRPATRDGEPYDFCTDVTFEVRLGGA